MAFDKTIPDMYDNAFCVYLESGGSLCKWQRSMSRSRPVKTHCCARFSNDLVFSSRFDQICSNLFKLVQEMSTVQLVQRTCHTCLSHSATNLPHLSHLACVSQQYSTLSSCAWTCTHLWRNCCDLSQMHSQLRHQLSQLSFFNFLIFLIPSQLDTSFKRTSYD